MLSHGAAMVWPAACTWRTRPPRGRCTRSAMWQAYSHSPGPSRWRGWRSRLNQRPPCPHSLHNKKLKKVYYLILMILNTTTSQKKTTFLMKTLSMFLVYYIKDYRHNCIEKEAELRRFYILTLL